MITVKDLTLSDVSIGELSSDELFFEVSKEKTEELFKASGESPCNECGEPDDEYVSGEIQVMFTPGTNDIEEVLLFPVYEEPDTDDDEPMLTNGDFIRVDEAFSDCAEYAIKTINEQRNAQE